MIVFHEGPAEAVFRRRGGQFVLVADDRAPEREAPEAFAGVVGVEGADFRDLVGHGAGWWKVFLDQGAVATLARTSQGKQTSNRSGPGAQTLGVVLIDVVKVGKRLWVRRIKPKRTQGLG